MTQTNYLKKYGQAILIAILIIALFVRCPSEPAIAYKDTANDKIVVLKEQLKAKQHTIDIATSKIESLQNENKVLQSEKQKVKVIYQTKIATAKQFTRSEIADFHFKRYNLPNDVKTVANGTELTDTIAKLVIVDLIGGDYAVKENELIYTELGNTKLIVEQKDTIIKSFQGKEVVYKSILEQKDFIIANDAKVLKSEKRKKNVNKILLGASLILNVFWRLRNKKTYFGKSRFWNVGKLKWPASKLSYKDNEVTSPTLFHFSNLQKLF